MAIMRKSLVVAVIGVVVALCAPTARSDSSAVPTASKSAANLAAEAALDRAKTLEKQNKTQESLAAGYQAIESDPDLLAAHDWLTGFPRRRIEEALSKYPDLQQKIAHLEAIRPQIKALREAIGAKYDEWMKRFPNSMGVLYGIGTQLYNQEKPEARVYLLRYAERDPGNAKVFAMLARLEMTAGDRAAAAGYFRKAMAVEPKNPEYALDYAYNLEPAKREPAILDVVNRFPNTDSAAVALGMLSDDATDDAHRTQYLEELRTQFPPEKSDRSHDGMGDLFEIYLRTNPEKAVALAKEMQATKAAKAWRGRVQLAQALIDVHRKLSAGKPKEALALLGKLKTDKYSEDRAMIERVKAQVMVGAGETHAAYRTLLQLEAKTPGSQTETMLQGIGRRLHKRPVQVRADITRTIYAAARPAPPFDLQEYTSNETVSLARLRGKVVLVTFWFPGCEPCAEEFPHFETVMARIRRESKDVAFIGINIVREQDGYVLSRVKRNKYTFIPLKGTKAVEDEKWKGSPIRVAPTNFVIDRSGRIVYSDFMIDDSQGEAMLQRMIESVL